MKKLIILLITSILLICFISTANALPVNVALTGTARQSSTSGSWDRGPELAIDDNTDGNFYNGSVTHTRGEQNAWWEVDLHQEFLIEEIDVWNRTDAYRDRLTPFTLSIYNSTGNIVYSAYRDTLPSNALDPFVFSNLNVMGQHVQVRQNTVEYMHIAEVQIWTNDGGTNPVPEPTTFLLFGTGLLGLIGIRRKIKVKSNFIS